MAHEENFYAQFKGNSSSGSRLLTSLYEYSMSYEQQKWSRFVHKLKNLRHLLNPEHYLVFFCLQLARAPERN